MYQAPGLRSGWRASRATVARRRERASASPRGADAGTLAHPRPLDGQRRRLRRQATGPRLHSLSAASRARRGPRTGEAHVTSPAARPRTRRGRARRREGVRDGLPVISGGARRRWGNDAATGPAASRLICTASSDRLPLGSEYARGEQLVRRSSRQPRFVAGVIDGPGEGSGRAGSCGRSTKPTRTPRPGSVVLMPRAPLTCQPQREASSAQVMSAVIGQAVAFEDRLRNPRLPPCSAPGRPLVLVARETPGDRRGANCGDLHRLALTMMRPVRRRSRRQVPAGGVEAAEGSREPPAPR